MLGSYDFVTVIQATDNETVTHLSVDLGSCVTVQDRHPAGDFDCAANQGSGRDPKKSRIASEQILSSKIGFFRVD